MNRRRFLASMAASAPAERPNILILFADDQRFDTIGALGNRHIRTPNLDRLARRGVSFDHAHIMGGTNGAVCIASRAMLLTGQTLYRAVNHMERGEGAGTLLGEHFRQAGYATYGIGKWHNPPPLFNRCFEDGSCIFFGGMSDQLRVPVQDYDPAALYGKQRQRTGDKFSSELFADAAIRFLERHDGRKPFLLYTAFTAPHDPRMAPRAYEEMYPPEKIPAPANFLAQHPFDNGELKVRDELLAPFPRTPEVVQRHIAAYYAMISHLDAQIGRVLDTLKARGREKNTIVVFAGDNGLALGQHGLFGKQSLYDHSVRVPLILAGPGIAANQWRKSLCYLLDVFPTLCELTRTATPASVEGQSLFGRERESLFLAYRDIQRAVRTRDWKLIEYRVGGKVTRQLFNMRADPLEMRDLSGVPGAKQRIEELQAMMRTWMERTGDPLK